MKRIKLPLLFMLLNALTLSSCSDDETADEIFEDETGEVTNETNETIEAETLIDVSYADTSAAQVMDIYIPEGEGPFPAVVYIHGGGFFTGDKSAGSSYAEALVENGYVAVSINYRLSGEAVFPAAVHDCKAAIRFLKANATTYRINASNIGSWGDSAGGNLASMLGTSSGDEFTEDLTLGNDNFSSKVDATVAWYSPINFSTIVSEANELGLTGFMDSGVNTDLEADYMGLDKIEDDPDLVSLANPTTYIDAEDASFFIQVGNADPLVPYTQSQNFYEALLAELGANNVSFELIEGAGHGGSEFDDAVNLEKVISFFDSQLK
ncbi:MAG: alpha/beta hydrolase [Bacteroidota bacterium]